MEETSETSNSTEKPEQIGEEGGKTEVIGEDEITDVTEDSNESEESEESGDAVEPASTTTDAVDQTEITSVGDSSTDSMDVAEGLSVSTFQTVTADGKTTYQALSSDNAVITYDENTVDDDGSVNKDAEKILFKLTPAAGKVITSVGFATAADAAGLTAEGVSLSGTITNFPDANAWYEVPTTVANLIAGTNKAVGIYVTTREAEYTVNFTSNAAGAKAYLKVKDADGKEKYVFTGSDATSTTVKYSDRDKLTFAATGLGKAADAMVKMADAEVTGGTDEKEGDVEYVEYTLKLSDVNGLSDSDTVTVTLDKKTAAFITLADADFEHTNVTVAKPDASLTAYKDHKELTAPGTYAPGDKIAFVATAAENYKVTDPVAYWTVDGDDTEHELKVEPKKEKDVTVYEIDLKEVTETANLHVEIGAELDETKDPVKTISFSAANGHVKVYKQGDSSKASLLDKGADKFTEAGNYTFVIDPDEGYQVTKVEAKFTKKYTNTAIKDKTEEYAIATTGAKLEEAQLDTLYPFNDVTEMTALFGDTDSIKDGDTTKSEAWTTKLVELTITTEVETAMLDAEVRFVTEGGYADTSKGAYGITVTPEEGKVEKKQKTDDTYVVKKGAQYLEFAVTGAESDPTVTVTGRTGDSSAAGKEIKYTKEGYTYKIPASSLAENTLVVVKRKTKTVNVNYNGAGSVVVSPVKDTDANVELTGSIGTAEAGSGYTQATAFTANADANVTLKIAMADNQKSNIEKVTYRVGEDGAEKTATASKDGSFEIAEKAVEDIQVYVQKSDDKKLYINGTEVNVSEVYRIADYQQAIDVQVYSGEQPLVLFSGSVKEGSKNAKTKAVIDRTAKNFATITVNKDEYNKPLDVTLTTYADRTEVKFTIIADNTISGLTYGNTEDIKDGKLSLPVDTQITTDVEIASNGAPFENLGVAVVDASATAVPTTNTPGTSNDKVAAQLTKTGDGQGRLTITTKTVADGAGTENAAQIVLYDKKNVKDNNYTIIEGSPIVVTTTAAVVKDEKNAPKASVSEKDASADSLRLKVEPVDLGSKLPNVGGLYYKVEVDASGITGADAALKEKIEEQIGKLPTYYKKADLEAKGYIDLQVIPTDEAPDAGVGGFKVNVTLLQTSERVYDVNQITEANSIEGKTLPLGPVSTMKPYYEDTKTGKLKLKNGTTTIYTGDTQWVNVAEPQFDKNATYTSVDVDFVDMKTGKERNPSGMAVEYNADTNKVIVHFTGKSYYYQYNEKTDTEYKDLGVKVTARTKSTGYGVSGTVKLTVANGIERIGATAQPYLYKESDTKTATCKVDINLNYSNNWKEYAPKNKKVDYEIVSAGTELRGNTEADLVNKAPAKAAAAITLSNGKTTPGVTVKNSTVTVAKEYRLSEKAEDNQFKVLVKAQDYTGNTAVGLTDVIEITGEPRKLGKLTIVTADGKPVSGGAVEVTTNSVSNPEYRAVLLVDGAEVNEHGCYTVEDFTDPNEVNFTPAKGGIYVKPNGEIVVTKFGKAAIQAVDKSHKNTKTDKLTVEFKQTSTPLALQITQVKDSDFNAPVKTYYDTAVDFNGNNVTYFGVDVVTNDEKHRSIDLSDVKLSFGKLKNITPKKWEDRKTFGQESYQYLVATTGKTGTITFQSKTMGNQKITYTLTNGLTIDKDKKAPKITLEKGVKIVDGQGTQLFSYDIVGAKKESFDGKYVMLTADETKKNPKDISYVFNYDVAHGLDRAIPVRSGNKLDIGMNLYNGTAGNYNLIAAVGTLEDGVFTQEYADAKVTVKVDKKGAINLKVTGNYTLDHKVASKVPIQYDTKNGKTWFLEGSDVDGNFAKNAIIDHTENKFNHYFEALADYDEYGTPYLGTIGLKSTLTKKEIEDLVNNPKSDDLTGFISVKNAGKQMDVKITIKFKSVEKSIKAEATPVLAGDDVVVDVTLKNGKERVPVKAFEVVTGNGFEKDCLINGPEDENGKVTSGDIRLKGTKVDFGKKEVTLKVTPENMAVYKEGEQTKDFDAFEVKVTVNVAKANTANKAVITKGQEKWTVSSSDYIGREENHTEGSWKKDITYSYKNRLSIKKNAKISVAWDKTKFPYVSLESDNYDADKKVQTLSAVIDKDALVKAEAADAKLKWGGKITVEATLSYADTTGEVKYDPQVAADKVKLTITLPGKPGADLTEDDLKALEPGIQNMVQTMTEYYDKKYSYYKDYIYEDADYSFEWCNRDIQKRIENMILAKADGSTIDVEVSYYAYDGYGSGAEYLANFYTVAVNGDFYTHQYDSWTQSDIEAVKDVLEEKSEDNWALVKADPDIDYFSLDENTSISDYETLIKKVLSKEGVLSNNIAISAALDKTVDEQEEGVKAPTTKADGYYNITVTITDKSATPGRGDWDEHMTFVHIPYTINMIENAGAVEARVNKELVTAKNISKDISDAWDAVATASMDLSVEENKKKLQDKTAELILARAKQTLETDDADAGKTANKNITVKGFAKDKGVKLTIDVNGKPSKIEYTLILTDSSEDADEEEIEIAVSETIATAPANFQTPDELKTAVQKIEVIPAADTEEKVVEEVTKKINDLKKNKSIDLSKMVVEVKANTLEAPEGDTNGLVSVTVDFTGKDATKTEITNIVILATGDDFKVDEPTEGTDEEKEAAKKKAKEIQRVTSAINAKLSVSTLKKMFADLSKNPVTDAVVKGKIAGYVNEVLGSAYDTISDTNVEFTLAEGAEFPVPEDAGHPYTLPAIKITVTAKDATLVTDKPIEISEKALGILPEFQTADEAKAAFVKELGTKALELGYIDGMGLKTEGTVGDGFNDASVVLLQAAVKRAIDAMDVVTGSKVTVNNAAETGGTNTTVYADGTGDYQYAITNWKVTFTGAETPDVYVKVNIKKAVATNAVSAVTFTKVDGKEIGENGTQSKPVEVTVSGTKETVAITPEVTLYNTGWTDANAKKLTWSAMIGSEKLTTAENKDTEGITIDPDTGAITIPDDAAGASSSDRTRTLKVTATSVADGWNGEKVTKDLYIKLTFVPEVSKVEISGPDYIELGDDGMNANGAVYTAAMTGKHLLTTDRTTGLKWTLTSEKDKEDADKLATITPGSADKDGNGTATVTFVKDASALIAAKQEIVATLSDDLKTDCGLTDNEPTGKKSNIEIRKYGDGTGLTKLPGITLGAAEGVAYVNADAEKHTPLKITVDGKDVVIPLSMSDTKGERVWTFGVTDGADTPQAIAGVTVEKKNKASTLKIANSVLAKDWPDDVKNEDGTVKTPAKTITITAEAAADKENAAIKVELEAALVINEKVDEDGLKLKQDSVSGDTGSTDINKTLTAGSATEIVLISDFEGNHVDKTSKYAGVTWKIAGQTKGMKATVEADENNATNGKATVTIPADRTATAGYVKVTASWKADKDAEPITATRFIKLTGETAARDITVTGGNTLEFKQNAATPVTKACSVSNVANVRWSVDVDDAEMKSYVEMNGANLTVSGLTLENSEVRNYKATVTAKWTENGVEYQKSVRVTIKVTAPETVTP